MASTMATYSVYHRYHEFKRLMYMNTHGIEMNDNYYNTYYRRNQCLGDCPPNSHCEWGFCECDAGMTKTNGRCANTPESPRSTNFNPFIRCSNHGTCSQLDLNLICNTNVTMSGTTGKCECRRDMRWNPMTGRCQIYMDVDCSTLEYSTPVSPPVITAIQKARQEIADAAGCPAPSYFCDDGETCVSGGRVCDGVADCPTTETGPGGEEEDGCENMETGTIVNSPSTTTSTLSVAPTVSLTQSTCGQGGCLNRTQTKEESLATSILTKIDPKTATAAEITEAFCRDIDDFSFEFLNETSAPVQMRDERPSQLCTKVPEDACAVGYDSALCSGGWRLVIHEGAQRFKFFSSWWSYRNDMDTIGVRAGCTFTGFSGSRFNGQSAKIAAGQYDRWIVFSREMEYQHIDEDIESLKCSCSK